MKKFILIFIMLVTTLTFPSLTYAKWTETGKSMGSGSTWYIDFTSVKEHGGYIYYWEAQDRVFPDKDGDLSIKALVQGDCKKFEAKTLQEVYYKQQKLKGEGQVFTPNEDMIFVTPNSIRRIHLEKVCNYIKK